MADDVDVSTSGSLTLAQRNALIERLKTAWKNLPADKQAALKPTLDEAHGKFARFADGWQRRNSLLYNEKCRPIGCEKPACQDQSIQGV